MAQFNEVDTVIFITFIIALYVFRKWDNVTRLCHTHLTFLSRYFSSSRSPTSRQIPAPSVPLITVPLPTVARSNPCL